MDKERYLKKAQESADHYGHIISEMTGCGMDDINVEYHKRHYYQAIGTSTVRIPHPGLLDRLGGVVHELYISHELSHLLLARSNPFFKVGKSRVKNITVAIEEGFSRYMSLDILENHYRQYIDRADCRHYMKSYMKRGLKQEPANNESELNMIGRIGYCFFHMAAERLGKEFPMRNMDRLHRIKPEDIINPHEYAKKNTNLFK